MSWTVPVPSTWPMTRWPPNRSHRRSALSRLTGSPTPISPRFVRLSVSADTSTPKVVSSREDTVRQTPLIQILSPRAISVKSHPPSIRRTPSLPCLSRAVTLPTFSTIPVNILLPPFLILHHRGDVSFHAWDWHTSVPYRVTTEEHHQSEPPFSGGEESPLTQWSTQMERTYPQGVTLPLHGREDLLTPS